MDDEIEIDAPVDEKLYRADLELLDRYQSYSAEITRLSLLGIGGLAFFAAQLPPDRRDIVAGLALGIAAILFALSTACALSHRYHSSDGLYYHIKAVRFISEKPPKTAAAKKAANKRNTIYDHSGKWLGAAASLFGAGGFFFIGAVARLAYLLTNG